MAHTLLGLANQGQVFGHPVADARWDGFVIETFSETVPYGTQLNFYRTAAGAEIDLLVTPPGGRPWAIEIKRAPLQNLRKGFISPARR